MLLKDRLIIIHSKDSIGPIGNYQDISCEGIGFSNCNWNRFIFGTNMNNLSKIVFNIFITNLLFQKTGENKMIARCPHGWTQRLHKPECYLFHTNSPKMSWDIARRYCQGFNADLFSIEDEDMKVIFQYSRSR